MAEAGPIRRILVPFLCLVVTGAAINNVYGNAEEVQQLAEQTACGKESCSVKLLEVSKTPFSHTYVFQTSVANQSTTKVSCSREMFLIGNYECEQQ